MKLKFAKLLILFIAAIVAIGSWFYTYFLVDRISEKERERIKLWAEAYNEIQMTDINQNISPLILTIIQSNTDIPVILCDQDDNIIGMPISTVLNWQKTAPTSSMSLTKCDCSTTRLL